MAQSLAKVYVHTVFSTKKRYPFIKPEIENELYSYIGGIITNLGGIPFQINGIPDHIHVFSTLPKTVSIAKFLEEIKRSSSKWIKTKGEEYKKFAWQNGYAAFSVSSSVKSKVEQYIANQKQHHQQLTFKEELIQFLKKYDVDYNKEYLFD